LVKIVNDKFNLLENSLKVKFSGSEIMVAFDEEIL